MENRDKPGVPVMNPLNGNSNKSKERKTLAPVVSGNSIRKKKTIGKRLTEAFVADDISNVKSYIIRDVIIPAIKETMFDTLVGSLEMTLFGRSVIKHYRGTQNTQTNTSRINYNGVSTQSIRQNTSSVVNTQKIPIDDVIVPTFEEAQKVIAEMKSAIMEYGNVRVSDFYSACRAPYDFTDEKWGWENLGNAEAVYLRGGRGGFINIPRPIEL